MEEKKMTDKEIMKALEYCVSDVRCRECPLFGEVSCIRKCKNASLDLIHRLQDKIAKYERKLADGELVSKDWHDEQVVHAELVMEEQKAEIERLTEENRKLGNEWDNTSRYCCELRNKIDKLEDSYRLCKDANETIKENCAQYIKDNAELQKQVDELKASDMSEMRDLFEVETDKLIERAHQQAVKDTAKEIFQELYNETIKDGIPAVYCMLTPKEIKDRAKRYGVEVE